MTLILRNGETAESVRERVGCDHDIPASVLLHEVTRDTDRSTAIREYPENDSVAYDVPNQICKDLKGTWRWRAVALHGPDGDVVEWYAYKRDVREYWPDWLDEPAWKHHSIYAFNNPPDDHTLALHPWPVDMDPDAEVMG